MVSLIRTLAVLVFLLPALIVPRGLVLSMCLSGYGLDATVCVVELGCAGDEVECSRASGEAPCKDHDGDPASGAPYAHAPHDATCPQCHTVSLDEPSIDFVAGQALDIPAPTLALAPSFDTVALAPPVVHTVSARGRAPPDIARALPGLWPGVRPLRI